MLMDATLSLEAIASLLGYSDLSNFSHAFKRWTGHSPGAFRRQQ
jgi:AraC-like DNA-binding protein